MRPDRASPEVRRRLAELATARKVTLAALSRMIGKRNGYLAAFVREGRPDRLQDRDIIELAAFLSVAPWELGKQH